MKTITNLCYSLLFLLMTGGCTKEPVLPSEPIENLGGYDVKGNKEIDDWIMETWTKPFNVLFKYRYDPFEVNYQVNSTPVKEEFVIPATEMIRQILVDPLIELKDSTFIRQLVPKLWVFLGSGEYQPDGTVTLGTAEVGSKITIMDVNKFDPANRDYVEWTMYVVFHELSHTLHQRIMYDPMFRYINPEWYTATWFNYSELEAYDMGFVRNYALANPDDDFVETVAYLLCRGQEKFDELVDERASDAGKKRLRDKERVIVAYFKDKYNIDFREWQAVVRERIEAFTSAHQQTAQSTLFTKNDKL